MCMGLSGSAASFQSSGATAAGAFPKPRRGARGECAFGGRVLSAVRPPPLVAACALTPPALFEAPPLIPCFSGPFVSVGA